MSVELQIKCKKSLTLKKKNKVTKALHFRTSYPYTTDIVANNDPSLTLSGEFTVDLLEDQKKYLMDHSNDISSSSTLPNIQQESSPAIEEFKCPICDKSLAGTTRLQKLDHANKCLDAEATHISDAGKLDLHTNVVPDNLDFQACVFCGKDMLTYNFHRREQHANRCLDEIVAEQTVIELSKKTAERKGVSIQELGRRLQWTNWGLSAQRTRQNSVVEDKPAEGLVPNSIQDANKIKDDSFVLCTSDDEEFQSLSVAPTKPLITTLKKNSKRKRKESIDEDLRLAIALSKSLMKTEKKLKSKKGRKITEQDRNSSSVLSIEESKSLVMINLNALLCTPCIKNLKTSISTPSIPASKLAMVYNNVDEQELENGKLSLWILASSMEANHQKYITPLLAKFLICLLGGDDKTQNSIQITPPLPPPSFLCFQSAPTDILLCLSSSSNAVTHTPYL
ncbi:hypothetical protein BC943DRAFT_340425 [Umbelopsis sp. AD052]|nr:hypothetical protein BC943DRAFT_340425 [Umbelopsis sp. AD052]